MKFAEITNPQAASMAVKLYMSAGDMTTFSHLGVSEEDAASRLSSSNSIYRLVVDDEGKLIGLVGFEQIYPFDRSGEPFICIVPGERGKGVGKKVSEMMLEWGVKGLNLRRISSTVLEGGASEGLLKGLGFELVGKLNEVRWKNGRYVGAKIYEFLNKENE